MFRLVKGLKTDSKEVEGRACMRGSDGKLCINEMERGQFLKEGRMSKMIGILMWKEMQ